MTTTQQCPYAGKKGTAARQTRNMRNMSTTAKRDHDAPPSYSGTTNEVGTFLISDGFSLVETTVSSSSVSLTTNALPFCGPPSTSTSSPNDGLAGSMYRVMMLLCSPDSSKRTRAVCSYTPGISCAPVIRPILFSYSPSKYCATFVPKTLIFIRVT